jgi:hypothetical protein
VLGLQLQVRGPFYAVRRTAGKHVTPRTTRHEQHERGNIVSEQSSKRLESTDNVSTDAAASPYK